MGVEPIISGLWTQRDIPFHSPANSYIGIEPISPTLKIGNLPFVQ